MQLPFDAYDPFTKEKYDRNTIADVGSLETACKSLFAKIREFNEANQRPAHEAYLADIEHVSTGEKRIVSLDPTSPGAYSAAEALMGRTWVVVPHAVPAAEKGKDKNK